MVGNDLGGRLGTRMAEIIARAQLDRLHRSGPLISRLAMAVQDDFFRITGAEVNRTVGPLFRSLAAHPDAPAWLHDTGHFVADGKGQWATLLAGSTTGAAMGAGILTLLTNELQPVIGDTIRLNPHMPLSPPDAAAVDIRGLSWGIDLWTDAGQAGMDRTRYNAIKAVQLGVLAPADIVEGYRRGLFTHATALALFHRAGFDQAHAEHMLTMAAGLVSIVDLAAMENRGIITVEQGRALAALTGYTAQQFDRFDLLAGEPPDLQTTILAWQRGVITEAQVDRAILQGPLRREWIETAKTLRWQPLPVTEAADAVNQGHMTLEKARFTATLSGLKPEDFQVIVDNAGIPPGPMEALDWVNRGIMSEQDFRTAFLESRIKNKYIDLYLRSRHRLLTLAEIRLLYSHGAMTAAQATTRLMQHGYTAEDAGIIVAGAHREKTAAARDLTQGQVLTLYEQRAIDHAEAADMLDALGYDAQETTWLLMLADVRRVKRFTDAVIARVRSGFVSFRIGEADAATDLDRANVPPDQRDDLITLWTLEREVTTAGLSVAQIQAAYRKGHIDAQGAYDRFRQRGYSDADATILVELVKPPAAAPA